MPFDINTAKPVQEKETGFDLSTAKPAEETQKAGTFDHIKTVDEIPGGQEINAMMNADVEKYNSPEQLELWRSKGHIGIFEAYEKLNKWEMLPYLNAKTIADDVKILNLAKRYGNGEQLSIEESQKLSEYVSDMMEIQARGYTLGGNFVNAGLQGIPYLVEAAVALGTMGGTAPGTAAKAISKAGVKKGVQIAVRNIAKQGIKGNAKNIAKGVGKAAFAGNVLMPHRAIKGYMDIQLNDAINVTDKGQLYIREAQVNPAIAALKAVTMQTIEMGSEMTGATLFRPVTAAGGRMLKTGQKMLPAQLVKNLDALGKTKAGKTFSQLTKARDAVGLNGWFEEMGEETVGDVLRTTFDLDGEEGYSFDQFGRAIYPGWEELLVRGGLIAIYGAGSNVTLDLANKLASKGIEQDKINEIIQNTSELEREKIVQNFNNLEATEEQRLQAAQEQATRDYIESDFYKKAVEAGRSEDEAMSASQLVAARAEAMSKRYGVDAKQWYDGIVLKGGVSEDIQKADQQRLFQNNAQYAGAHPSESEEAIKEWQAKGPESKFFKKWFGDSKVVDSEGKPLVVYHGSEDTDVDEFRKDYIRTEYGFFFSDNKKVADEYSMNVVDNIDGKTYPVYLSMKNPLVIDAQGKEYNSSDMENWIDQADEGGNDGIIINNIIDKRFNDSEGFIGNDYVVFEPEQIKSVNNKGTFSGDTGNIYYQENQPANTVDWTDKFEKTPTNKELSSYLKELFKAGAKFVTLSPDYFIDIPNTADKRKHIVFPSRYQKLSDAEKRRLRKYITGIEELIANAEYQNEAPNKKKDKKPGVEKYHYFKTNVKIGEDIFEIILDTEQYSGESEKKPQTVHLYEVKESKKIPPTVAGDKRPVKDTIGDINNNITYFDSNFNPKGQIELGNEKKIITLFENADASTILHELGHLFLNDLIELSKVNEKAAMDMEAVNDWLQYNGQEYAREQHEKFARGFEAYVMSGKAPTTFLKRVFENFREWLMDIYKSLGNLNVEYTDEAQKLFDRLFIDKDQDAEYKQAKQLVGEAVSYSYKNSDSKLKNEAKKIIQELFRVILNTETGKNYDLKGAASVWARNKKNDKFRGEAGNWGTEHSYDELAQGIFHGKESRAAIDFVTGELFLSPDLDDFNSAEFASNVLNLYSIEAWDYAANPENVTQYADLDGIEKQYAYILKSFKTSKNRIVEQMAFFEWLDSIDETFQNDFAEQWMIDTNSIERLEKLDKFERAKEIILQNVNMLRDFNKRQEYENVIKAAFDSIKFLTATDKYRLLNNILSMKTVEDLKNNIDDIIDLSKTMEDVNLRRVLAKKIDKIIHQGSEDLKQGAKKVGKYDYATNQIFKELRRISRMKKDDVVNEFQFPEIDEENPLTFEEKLLRKYVNFRSDYVIAHSSDFLTSLYEDLIQLKVAGKISKDEIEHEKRLNKRVHIDELLQVLSKKKEANPVTKQYVPLFANWESALNTIFNRNMKEMYSLLDKEADTQVWAWNEKKSLTEKAAAAYGIKNHQLDSKIIDNLSEKIKVFEYIDNVIHERELNKMNIIEAYIWSKNPVIRERLLNQFGDEIGLNELFRNLTEEDIAFADVLQRQANSYYNEANKVFIKKYGIELPKVENYFPSQTERVSEVDLLNEYVMRSTSPSFIKSRSKNATLIMKFSNPMSLIYQHIDKMSRFINMTEQLDMYNQVFKNPVMNRAISAKYGENTYKALVQMLANSSYTKKGTEYDGWSGIINNLINNWVTTKIAIKPSIVFKQLLSQTNYASDMPVLAWGKYYLKSIKNPKKTIKFMMDGDPYLKARFESGGQAEFLEETINNSQFAKTKKMKDWLSLSTRIGDIGAIAFGGKPYVDYLMNEKGLSKEEAFREFRLATLRSQQASMPSSLSNFQNAKSNPIIRGLFAFRNTSNQYMRKAADSIISYANGDISKEQMAKELFIYTFFNTFMYRTATSLAIVRFLVAGEEDDLIADIIQSIFDLNSKVVPFFGDVYQYALARINGQHSYPVQIPVLSEFIQSIDKMNKKEVGFEDYMFVLNSILEIFLGVPADTITTMGSGTGDIAQGDVGKGILKTAGYSDYTANKATNKD